MKYTAASSLAFVVALAAASVATAFVPTTKTSTTTSASSTTARNALADRIFNLDLFAPVKDQNDYGARKSKNIKTGKITEKSYIPSGLTKAQYETIRKEAAVKKEKNYAMNVKKAGVFTDYTEWYTKRGTDLNAAWKKSVTLGHSMAKTKYDWSGTEDAKKFESTNVDKFSESFFGKKKIATPVKKIVVVKKPAVTKAYFNYGTADAKKVESSNGLSFFGMKKTVATPGVKKVVAAKKPAVKKSYFY